MGLRAGTNICPRRDRQEDGVLEPALSEMLDRQTNGQAVEAAQSRHQLSVPGQIGPHEVTLLSSPVVLEPAGTFKKAPKTKEPGPVLRGSAPGRGTPGAASTPCPGSGVAVAALSSERNHTGWPDIQAIPNPISKPWATSTPLWPPLTLICTCLRTAQSVKTDQGLSFHPPT